MSEVYYIIPMVAGPYSRSNPQRPDYVDEIRCNWTGHNLDRWNVYICKVNTTEAKHLDLASRVGVRQIPRNALTTLVQDLPAGIRTQIHTALDYFDLPYEDDESLKELLQRIIVSGLFELPNVNRNTLLKDLPLAVRQKGASYLTRWNIPYSGNDSVGEIIRRCRDLFWNPQNVKVEEF